MAIRPEYQTLDERAILKQLGLLRLRVAERFPTRGLAATVAHLADVARPAAQEAASLGKSNWALRVLSLVVILTGAYGFYELSVLYRLSVGGDVALTEFAQGLEAALNIMLITGLVILFFLRLESRFKRVKALNGLYRLRAIAHVIDMHQLTKDPSSILGASRTSSSPLRDLDDEQLLRYLDYCAEMLSLTGKLAALYAQYFPDPTVIAAVNDIEQLTTNLSRKIWQKIMLVQQGSAVNSGGA
ncbi:MULTISPECIES: hypothetical protein [Rhodomicrobium]|uniref:hypothetical protein n=1 Tax=Rhodomicrobium TaxID=1068 RepID=UPI000B4AA8A1|nr:MULTISPECIES: hypothetical protein [Rhodomicrobium]